MRIEWLKSSMDSLGYGMIGEVESYNHSKATSSSVSNHHNINFSSAPSSSSRFMPSIPENVSETISGARAHENGHFFPQDSWNNDASFSSLKRNRDGDMKMFSNFSGLEDQVGISPFCSFNQATILIYRVGFD